MRPSRVTARVPLAALAALGALLAGCTIQSGVAETGVGVEPGAGADVAPDSEGPAAPPWRLQPPHVPPDEPARGTVTLGFAGDVHFELHLRSHLDGGPRSLGPITDALQAPDLMMLNVETALTTRGTPEPKLYTFRAPPRALDTLRDAGVDVVSLANNHAADYGAVGVADTLEGLERSGLPAVGFGEDLTAALTPFTTEIRGTDIAVFGMSDRPEETAANWYADTDRPGILTRRHVPQLVAAVREAKRTADVVVVYAHWGEELERCPTERQHELAQVLGAAGVDVLIGSHAHVLLGSGWRGDTYVSYGLGNFVWYHDDQPDSGVLTLTVRDGEVVADDFAPAVIQPGGLPRLREGAARPAALAEWDALRSCTNLTAAPPG